MAAIAWPSDFAAALVLGVLVLGIGIETTHTPLSTLLETKLPAQFQAPWFEVQVVGRDGAIHGDGTGRDGSYRAHCAGFLF